MPLRDHFHPPLDSLRYWEGFHATWPVMMVARLQGMMPPGYFAEPRVHSGVSVEIDVATFEAHASGTASSTGNGNGGIATAIWAPPRPTFTVASDLPAQDVYEVRVYDEKRGTKLVAAVEIVSPGNKDRQENRGAFVAKCAGLLRDGVAVVIVDVVTNRSGNLYAALLNLLGHQDPRLGDETSLLYATACRYTKASDDWQLETWTQKLSIADCLPTMPLWLSPGLALPLELEESYDQSCALLNID